MAYLKAHKLGELGADEISMNLQGGLGGYFGDLAALGQPAQPVFRFQCPAGCPPLAANQCQGVLRQAIRSAIFLANNAASKLERASKVATRTAGQDDETIRLYRFFFGHDPSRPVPWAGNQESGLVVAHRYRKAAEALLSRNTLYRCGCPGARPTVNAQTNAAAEANVIKLCTNFWNPPAGMRLSKHAFRAGVIMHEMLHLLYHEFFHHPGHPSGDPVRRRDEPHCYEAFALRIAGHAADPSDVRACRNRSA